MSYIGADPSNASDVENRLNVENLFAGGVTREYVTSRVHDLALPYATKTYVDTQDALYSSASYFASQDALLVPNAARGVANGVASLGSDAKVPSVQIPVLGVGMLKGPFPVSHTFSGDTFEVPFKIADWTLGVLGITCVPWVFMAVSIVSDGGRPVVEVRAGTPTQTAYTDQTLVAQGYGRTFYNDYQTVEVFMADPDLGEHQDGVQDAYGPTTNLVLTAWMFDDAGGQVTTQSGLVVTASAFLARTTL